MSDPTTPQPDDAAAAAPQPPAAPQPAAAAPPPPASAAPPPAAPPAAAAAAPQYAQQPPPQYAAPAASAPLSPEADRQAAMWANIGGIIGFLPSLIIWLIFKDRGPVTNVEAKEALNWQITFTIAYVAIWILTIILGAIVWVLAAVLWLLPLALWVLNIVWSIMGGLRVNSGGSWRYPINFRLIK